MSVRKKSLYSVFIFILLSTEIFHIGFMGGVLRPYHFLVPFVIFFLSGHLHKLTAAPLFWGLFIYLGAAVLSAALANDSQSAFKSLVLLLLNMSIAISVALILVSYRLSLGEMVRIVLIVCVFSVVLGLAQLVLLKIFGIDMGLTEAQSSQLSKGFSTGLRTEANTFAKYLNTVFLLLLPVLLVHKNRRVVILIASVLIVGILTSLTRSAIYGLSITLFLIYIWYLGTGRGRVLSMRTVLALILVFFALWIFSNTVSNYNTYAAQKLSLFFDREELLEGNSSAFRLRSQEILWNSFTQNDKTFWFGNGWGQVTFLVGNQVYQASGAEIVIALGYGGVLGGAAYILYQFLAFTGVAKATAIKHDPESMALKEGVLFALTGLFVTGQINSASISPEYWLVYGMAIAIISMNKRRSAHNLNYYYRYS